ncbi:hypothetical protein COLO4_07149 [Corchorus olitorius]|uniref:Uncharacterized protein n=1 Tax=Corchorus olitorius TaxID=93759 RepID=A0A1R3KKQ0_9ROSI|nr:hypothetical protein COLO4_07149 [Corchorus olitorius]
MRNQANRGEGAFNGLSEIGGARVHGYEPYYLSLNVVEGSGANFRGTTNVAQLVPGVGPATLGFASKQGSPFKVGSGSRQVGLADLGLGYRQIGPTVLGTSFQQASPVGMTSGHNKIGLPDMGFDKRGILDSITPETNGYKRIKPNLNNEFGLEIYSTLVAGHNSQLMVIELPL